MPHGITISVLAGVLVLLCLGLAVVVRRAVRQHLPAGESVPPGSVTYTLTPDGVTKA